MTDIILIMKQEVFNFDIPPGQLGKKSQVTVVLYNFYVRLIFLITLCDVIGHLVTLKTPPILSEK